MGEAIQERISQLITITGARGTGKTTLAATFNRPSELSKVVYFDTEKSANRFRKQLMENGLPDFGMYVDLQDQFSGLQNDDDLLDRLNRGEVPWVNTEQKNALIGYYKYLLECFAAIPKNKFSTLVIDTGEKLEAGMAAYVETNKSKFGITTTAYGKLWTEGVFPLYEQLLQALWARGIENLIITFHLKSVWEGTHVVPGKVAMAGKKILYRLSSLMLWLVNDSRNPNGEPAGLVLKERQGHVGATSDDEWDLRQMLPPRIPTCTWKEIRRYLKEGYNVQDPGMLEIRTAAEEEMISPLLTDAQTALMLADAKLQEQENVITMAQSGLLPVMGDTPNLIGESELSVPVTIRPDNSPKVKPSTRAEAIQFWKNLGRPIPQLLKKIMNMSDGEIGEKWDEIIGGGDEN